MGEQEVLGEGPRGFCLSGKTPPRRWTNSGNRGSPGPLGNSFAVLTPGVLTNPYPGGPPRAKTATPLVLTSWGRVPPRGVPGLFRPSPWGPVQKRGRARPCFRRGPGGKPKPKGGRRPPLNWGRIGVWGTPAARRRNSRPLCVPVQNPYYFFDSGLPSFIFSLGKRGWGKQNPLFSPPGFDQKL